MKRTEYRYSMLLSRNRALQVLKLTKPKSEATQEPAYVRVVLPAVNVREDINMLKTAYDFLVSNTSLS